MNMYPFVLSQCCSNVASNFRSPLVLPPHSQFNSLHTLHVVLQPSLSAAYLNTNYYLPPLGCGRKKNKWHKNILLSTDNVLIKVSDGDICQSSKVRSTADDAAFITLRRPRRASKRQILLKEVLILYPENKTFEMFAYFARLFVWEVLVNHSKGSDSISVDVEENKGIMRN